MPNGVVKWFDPERGLGIITPDGGGRDAVAHHLAVHGDVDRVLVVGSRVCFGITQDADGVRADNIRLSTRLCCPPPERLQDGAIVWMVPPGLPPRPVPVGG